MSNKTAERSVPIGLAWKGDVPVVGLARWPGGARHAPLSSDDLAGLPSEESRLAEARQQKPSDGATPLGFIFHMGRSGSTLVAQMLAALEDVVVLDEPEALQDALLAPAEVSQANKADVLRQLVAMYIDGLDGSKRGTIVKWASWVMLHFALIREAFPDTPCVFVSRDPVEVLVSITQRPPAWSHEPEVTAPLLALAGSEEPIVDSPELQFFARCLRGICLAAAAHRNELRVIDYAQLPDGTWDKLAPAFGLSVNAGAKKKMQEAARVDAKDRSRARFRAGRGGQARIGNAGHSQGRERDRATGT